MFKPSKLCGGALLFFATAVGTASAANSGYCNWGPNGDAASSVCDGNVQGGDWCNADQSQCETGCGGRWCTNVGGGGGPTSPSPPTQSPPTGAGVATTTRYWDCSGGACGCAYLPSHLAGDNSQPAHCHSNAMFKAPAGNEYGATFYGTAAISEGLGGGNWLASGCGKCWKVTGKSNVSGNQGVSTTLVLMGTNFCPPDNTLCANGNPHFDIAAPGFDVLKYSLANTCDDREPDEKDAFKACGDWKIGDSTDGEQCDCNLFNSDTLREGCANFLSLGWDNPQVTYEEVACPTELENDLPCWTDNGNGYPDFMNPPELCLNRFVEDDAPPEEPEDTPSPVCDHVTTPSPVVSEPPPPEEPATPSPVPDPVTLSPVKNEPPPPTSPPTPPGSNTGYCNWGPNGDAASSVCDKQVQGGDWCNTNQANCETPTPSGCGGRWCTNGHPPPEEPATPSPVPNPVTASPVVSTPATPQPNPPQQPPPSPPSPTSPTLPTVGPPTNPNAGYCNWGPNGDAQSSVCDGEVQGGDWCNQAQANCETPNPNGCGGRWCTDHDAGPAPVPPPEPEAPPSPPSPPSSTPGSYCCSHNYLRCSDDEDCNGDQAMCEGSCSGTWIDHAGMSCTLGLWEECTNNADGCCAPSTCQGDEWYSQCLI